MATRSATFGALRIKGCLEGPSGRASMSTYPLVLALGLGCGCCALLATTEKMTTATSLFGSEYVRKREYVILDTLPQQALLVLGLVLCLLAAFVRWRVQLLEAAHDALASQQLECPICQERPGLHVSRCGHHYCHVCILEMGDRCWMCRKAAMPSRRLFLTNGGP